MTPEFRALSALCTDFAEMDTLPAPASEERSNGMGRRTHLVGAWPGRGPEHAMDQASTVYRLPSKALVFDGPAGAVTLFTQ